MKGKSRLKHLAACACIAVMTAAAPAAAFVPCPAYAQAAQSDALARVSQMIAHLPEKDDVTLEDADLIKEVEKAYNALSSAEKARVQDVARLTAARQRLDQLTGESVPEEEEAEEIPAVDSYSIEFTEQRRQATVIISYVYDADGDGVNDVPHISITPPGGSPVQVTNISTEIRLSGFEAGATWEANGVRFDISSATLGKWIFSSSLPVTFKVSEYAGKQQVVKPKEEEAPEEEKKKGTPFVLPIAFVAVLAGLFAISAAAGKKKDDKNVEVIRDSLQVDEDSKAELQRYLDEQAREYSKYDTSAAQEEKKSRTITQQDIEDDEDIEEGEYDTEDFNAVKKAGKGTGAEEEINERMQEPAEEEGKKAPSEESFLRKKNYL